MEYSQTDLLSSVAARQMTAAQPHQEIARSTATTRYTPEEDEYIKELKAQDLAWNKIEALFAQRFPVRKKSCLAARYCKLQSSSKSGRKGRIKSKLEISSKRGTD